MLGSGEIELTPEDPETENEELTDQPRSLEEIEADMADWEDRFQEFDVERSTIDDKIGALPQDKQHFVRN